MMPRTRFYSFHFDLGNSRSGPIGLCARVSAPTESEAVALLRAMLPDSVTVSVEHPAIEYVEVYLNAAAIGRKNIDDCAPLVAGGMHGRR